MIDALAAIGRHKLQLLGIGLDHPGDEVAALLLKEAQHPQLVLETLLRQVTAEGLVHPAVETDANQRPGGVFDVMHVAAKST